MHSLITTSDMCPSLAQAKNADATATCARADRSTSRVAEAAASKPPPYLSRAAIKLRHRQLAMAQGLRRSESAVGRTHNHIDQRIAGLIERHFSTKHTRNIDIDMFAHGADCLGLPEILITGTIGLPITLPWPGREGMDDIAASRHQGHAFGCGRGRIHEVEARPFGGVSAGSSAST